MVASLLDDMAVTSDGPFSSLFLIRQTPLDRHEDKCASVGAGHMAWPVDLYWTLIMRVENTMVHCRNEHCLLGAPGSQLHSWAFSSTKTLNVELRHVGNQLELGPKLPVCRCGHLGGPSLSHTDSLSTSAEFLQTRAKI